MSEALAEKQVECATQLCWNIGIGKGNIETKCQQEISS